MIQKFAKDIFAWTVYLIRSFSMSFASILHIASTTYIYALSSNRGCLHISLPVVNQRPTYIHYIKLYCLSERTPSSTIYQLPGSTGYTIVWTPTPAKSPAILKALIRPFSPSLVPFNSLTSQPFSAYTLPQRWSPTLPSFSPGPRPSAPSTRLLSYRALFWSAAIDSPPSWPVCISRPTRTTAFTHSRMELAVMLTETILRLLNLCACWESADAVGSRRQSVL